MNAEVTLDFLAYFCKGSRSHLHASFIRSVYLQVVSERAVQSEDA